MMTKKQIERIQLRQNVLHSMMAIGLMATSMMGVEEVQAAGTITRVDQTNTNLMQNGKADIYAETVSDNGKVGLNRFDRFQVDQKELANLYFRKEAESSPTLDALVNTVNNRIDIQGTVNAIRDNKVGGNLYFLSPKGMVVGAGGVINAGSLTAISTNNLPENINDAVTAIGNIQGGKYETSDDLDSSIVIHGAIHAATGIDLRAASIELSKEGNTDRALLQTGVLFDTTVNNDKVTSVSVKEGRLTASLDKEGNVVIADPNDATNDELKGDGGIYLRASADSRNDKTEFLGFKAYDNTVTAKATVGEGATIDAIGNVEISTDAQLSNDTKLTQWWYFMGFTKAETEVNGHVSGANVNITSKAKTDYSYGNFSNLFDVLNEATKQGDVNFNSDFTGMLWEKMEDNGAMDTSVGGGAATLRNFLNQLYMPFNITDAKATTTIGEKADITSHILKDANNKPLTYIDSKGEKKDFTSSLNVSASSTAKNKMKVKLQPRLKQGTTDLSKFFTGGFIYEDSSSNAIVNIDGKLTSDGDMNIEATAENANEAALGIKQPKFYKSDNPGQDEEYQGSMFMTGVNLVFQDTNAEINIGKNKSDTTLTAGVDLNLSANSDNSLSSEVSIAANTSKSEDPKEDTALSTVINVVGTKGNAVINNDGALYGENVSLDAEHTLSDFDLSTSNDFEGEFTGIERIFDSDTFKSVIDNTKWLTDAFRISSQNAAGNNVQNPGGGQDSAWNQYFDVGAAVAVANVTNQAQINLKPTSKIKASGDVALDAKVNIDDTHITTSDVIITVADNAKVGASAAAAVENMNNTAEINVESDTEHQAELEAEGDVTMHATVEQRYTRANRLVQDLIDGLKAAKEHITDWESDDQLKDKFDKVQNIIVDIDTLLKKDKAPSAADSKKVSGKAMAALDIIEQVTGTQELVSALEAFADASSYANMYVASAAKGGADEEIPEAKGMASGSVGIQNLHNTANINLGANTKMTSGGLVDLKANVVESNLQFIGKQALIPTIDTTKKTENGLGGSVGVQNSYNNSGIQAMNGVEITAGSISLATDNDILNMGLVYGGTQTSKLGITGMVSYMGGESNAKTLVDDDVVFTASKKVENKEGEDKVTADGAIAITAKNNANVINVVGGVTQTQGSAIGASTGVISYDVHTLAKVENQEVDKEGKATETAATAGKKGKLSANSIRVDALTDGIINNLTVAGGINSQTENKNASGGGVNVAAGGGQAAGGVANASIGDKVNLNAVGSVSWNYVVDETAAKLDGVDITLTTPEFGAGVNQKDMSTTVTVNAEDKSYIGAYSGAMALSKMGAKDTSKFRGSLAGAVAVNDLKKSTTADFSHISMTGNTADIRNAATNSGVQVATGLSLGLETGKHGDGTSINLAASGSANYIDSTVHATMSDNTLEGTGMTVNNTAYDKDVQVAGGVTAEFAGATASVGAAVTVNQAKNDIQATLVNNTITASAVNNLAASNLTQVGTAISVGVATGDKAYATLNVAVADNEVTNTVNASIDGGTITAGTISVEARDGKLSETEEKNKYIDELNTVPGSLTNFDGDENSTSETKHIYDLDGSDALKEANGTTGANVTASIAGEKDKENAEYKTSNIELTNKGNTIVGVALGLGVKTGDSGKLNGTGAAATVINKVKNDFTAKVSDATLTTTKDSTGASTAVKVIAGSDTRMVGVAAGVAVGTSGSDKPSLSLSGSGVKQTIQNDTTATVEDTIVTADELAIQGKTTSSLVSVAGQVSAETSMKGVAGGLSWAENEIQNITGAYAKGLTLQGLSSGATNLKVWADNQAKMTAVGVGAAGTLGYGSAEGAYAANHGTNSTEVMVDQGKNGKRNTLTNVNSLIVKANDQSEEKAVAGTLAATVGMEKAGATLGGAVSYNNIGNSADDRQKVQAKLSYADITTVENGNVNVSATNAADFLTLALGGTAKVGGTDFGISAQGSVATSTLYTDTYAGMDQTKLNQGKDHRNAKLYIDATSKTKSVTSADALSVNASLGVDIAATGAVSVVRSDADTRTEIKDSQLKLQDVVAKAQSENEILDIAIGLGVGASADKVGASAVGNIVSNRIANDTTLSVENTTIDANGTAALLARSHELLRNYGGAISVGASAGVAGAALGVTVVTNTIEGNTTAVVNNSSLTAAGNGDGVEITNHAVVNDGTGDESKDAVKNYQKHTVQDTTAKKKGLIVNADAVHELRDISVTAGVGASATVGVAVDATVALNTITGKTSAEINNTDINKNLSYLPNADVSVRAYDKADISSHIGTLSVGASGTAGVGAAGAGDRNVMSRETIAKIANVETKALHAHDVDVNALGYTKLYISESGVGVGASGVAGASAVGSVSSDSLTGNTTALVTGVTGKVHGLTIDAERLAKVDTYNNAIALSGGIYSGSVSVGVTNIDDTSHTNAELSNAILGTDGTTDGSVNVLANNHTELGTELSGDALAVSIGGAAGISVLNANMESQVGTKVSGVTLGNLAEKRYFNDVNVKSLNDVYSRYQNVAVGVGTLLGVAVAKGALNINTGTTADVWNSQIYAAQDITVSAEEKRTINSDMVGIGVGALNVGVNAMYTNIGTNLKDTYDYDTGADSGSSTGSYKTDEFQNYVNGALKRLNQQADLAKEKTGDTSIAHGSDTLNKGNVNADGVKTTIQGSTLQAGNDLNVSANIKTNTDIDIKQASFAIVDASIAANRVDVEDKLGVTIDQAKLQGKSIGITTLSDGTIASYTGQGTVSGASYMDTTGYVRHHGKNLISIDGSQLKATENSLWIEAMNGTRIDNSGLAAVNFGGLISTGRLSLESEDDSEVYVELGKHRENENILEAAGNVIVLAKNDPHVKTENKASVDIGLLEGAGTLVVSKATGKVGLDVTKQNTFNTNSTTLLAISGVQGDRDSTNYTTEAINHAVGVSGVGASADKARTVNSIETALNLEAAKFTQTDDKGHFLQYGNLSAGALDKTSSRAYITSTKVGLGIASGNNFAQSYTTNKTTLTLDTGNDELKVKDLDMYASSSNVIESHAKGSSAGILSISPYLAKVENTANNTTQTTIKGKITTTGHASLQATHEDIYNLQADGLTVTVVGGGAAAVENKVINDTGLDLNQVELNSAGDVLLDAQNSTAMNQGKEYQEMVRGAGVSAVDVDRSLLDNTLISNTHVNLNQSKILTAGDLQLISHTDEKLQANAYVYNVSAVGGAESKINHNITNDDKITLIDSTLKTTKVGKDITLSAADDVKFYTNAYAETATGIISGANALLYSNLTRNNQIDMSQGNNSLFSTQDIYLYAGKNADGSLGLLDMNMVASDFIGGFIPVPITPTVKNTLQQNNQITIGKNSASRSVRHTELYASQGREMANVSTNRYMGIYDTSEKGSFVTTDKGETIEGKMANNFVKIDGSAIAGIANKIDIVIGEVGDVVIRDKTLRDTVSGAKDTSDIKISVKADASTGLTKDSLHFGSEDYTSTLYKRYEEVQNLMIEYAKDGESSAAYQGYKAEAERIKNEMLTMGLAELDTDGKTIIPKTSLSVDYVEIPELTGSGGNITVDTDDLMGSGTVKAQGTPEISITNNTNLMTKINSITVDDPGGKLVFNGQVVSGKDTAEFNKNINAINKGNGASFGTVEAADGQSGKINITGNYNGNSLSYKGSLYDETEKKWVDVVGSIKPMANILIQGNIYSKEGDVQIKSAHDSIVIQGKTAKDAVAINGATITLDAANGNITQGYTDGIVNIGADVREQYKDAYENAIKKGSGSYTIGQITTTIEDGSEAKGSYIAGGSVYINASDINVNGVIQSGFGDYYADISDSTTQDAIQRINNAYDGQRELSDAAVTTGDRYKIINGGAIWDAKEGCYKYRLNVYYNPSTKKILVQNVDAGGGRIYLTGRISSTGNGQIICLDGVSDITVKNTTSYDLKLGDLTTHEVSGLVSIQDTAKNTLTEITNGKTTVRNIDSNGKISIGGASRIFDKDKGYDYNPKTGLKYTWTTGQESMNYEKYSHEEETGGWSIKWSSSETYDHLAEWTEKLKDKPDSTGTSAGAKRPDGETIRIDTSSTGSTVNVSQKTTNKLITLDGVERWSTGLWGYYRHTKMYWTKATGTRDTYDASIKADNPIHVKFIGKNASDGRIDVNSNTSIEMTGNIGNTKLYETKANDQVTSRLEKGTVNIASRDGSLLQTGGALYGENINLAAGKDIRDINIVAGDVVNLSAIQDATGKNDVEQNAINITVNAGYLAKGNVVLGNVGSVVAETKDGKNTYKPLEESTGITGLVDITTTGSEGSISQKDDAVRIVSDRINLTSTNGSIYGQKQADGSYTSLKVYAGQQPIGLDTLDASINAKAKGDISLEQTAGDMRIGQIISTDGDVSLTVAKGSVVDALPYVSNDRGDADDLLERWRAIGLIDGNDEMKAAKNKLNHYVDEKSGKKDLGDYKEWDANALLYAIQDSVVNQTSENLPKTSEKDPNVIGHNITITVADSVGLNSGNQKRIDMTTLLEKDSAGNYLHMDDLKALSKADASMVTWENDGKTAVITEKLPIGVQQTTKTKVNDDGTTTVIHGSLTLKSAATVAGNSNAGNIFIEGRDQKDNTLSQVTKDLHLGEVATNVGDITISSLGGIYQQSPNTFITGRNLYLTAANGSIGTKDQYLMTKLFGTDRMTDGLSAVASGGIYIDQKGNNDLILRSISSGGDIYLGSDTSMVMGEVNGTDTVNYIRAENNGSIALEAIGGSLGEAETDEEGNLSRKSNKGIRILNAADKNGSQVTLKARDNIFVTGVASHDGKTATKDGAAGVLNLTVGATSQEKLQNVGIAVDGSLHLNGSVESKDTASIFTAADLQNENTISSADTYLGSAKNLHVSGKENTKLIGSNKLTLEAGQDVEIEEEELASKNLRITAGQDMRLENVDITADVAHLTAQKDISYRNLTKDLTVSSSTTMEAQNILLSAEQNHSLTTSGTVTAKKKATLQGEQGVTQSGGDIKAETVTLSSSNDSVNQTAGSVQATNTMAKAGKDISLASETNKLQHVSVDARHGSATIVSANDGAGDLNITTVGMVANDLTIKNLSNGVANKITFDKNLQAGGKISITNEEANIDVAEGTIMSAQDITLVAKNHDVNFTGGEVIAKGTLSADAQIITQSGGTIQGATAILNAEKAISQTNGSLIAKDMTAKAGTDMALASRTNKLQNVTVDAQHGSATIVSANDAAGDLNITTEGMVANDLTIKNLSNGVANKITFNKNLQAGGKISITNEEADIDVTEGTTMGAKDITLVAKGYDVNFKGGTVSASGTLQGEGKNISISAGTLMGKEAELKATNQVIMSGGTLTADKVQAEAEKMVFSGGIINAATVTANRAMEISGGTIHTGEVEGLIHAGSLHMSDGLVDGKTLSVTSDADIAMSGGTIEATTANITAGTDFAQTGGTIHATDKVTLESDRNILLTKGSLSAENVDMIALGYVDETYDNGDTASTDDSYKLTVNDTLQVLAGGYNSADGKNYGVDLGSRYNKLSKVIMNADNGNITIGNGGKEDLRVSVQDGETVDGNIDIHNWNGETANDVIVDGSLQATGTINIHNDEKDVIVQAPQGSTKGGLIKGQEIQIAAAGNITNQNAISSVASTSLMAHGNIDNAGDIQVGQNILMMTEDDGSIDNRGTIEAKETVTINAGKDISNVGKSITAGGTLQMKAGTDIINVGESISAAGTLQMNAGHMIWNLANISSTGGDVSLEAGQAVMNTTQLGDHQGHGTIKAAGDITLKTNKSGSSMEDAGVYNDADIEAGKNVDIDSMGQLKNMGNILAKEDVYLDAEGNLDNSGKIEADGDIRLSSDKLLSNTGDITSKQSTVTIYALDGLVNGSQAEGGKTGNISAKDLVDIFAYNGNVTNYGDIRSTDGMVSLNAAYAYDSGDADTTKSSDIENHGTIEAAQDVLLQTLNGNISNQAQITSKKGTVTMEALRHQTYTGSASVGDIDNGFDSNHYDDTADIKAANGIILKADGSVYNTGDFLVTGKGNITVRANQGDIINFGNYYTPEGTIHLQAKEDVLNLGVMETAKGNVELTSDDGSIYNQMGADLLSGDGDIILHAKSQNAKAYYYNDAGELVAVPEGAQVKSYTDPDKLGGQYIEIDGKAYDVVKNGSVFNGGDALAMNGTIHLISDNGDVTNYDDFDTLRDVNGQIDSSYHGTHIATGNVEISAKNGTLFNSKDIEAGGDVTLTAADGLTNFAYNVYAGKNITLTATRGDVVNSAILESYAGDVTLWADNGNVINGVKDVGTGDIITYGGNVTLSANGYDATGKAGSVTNYGDIIAINANAEDKEQAGSITLISQHGDVDNFDDFNTYKQDGVYYKDYTATKHGSISSKDASYNLANNNLTISAKEGHVFTNKDYLAALGNVTLEAKSGLSSFGKVIYAGKNITLNATEGDLFNRAELLSVEGDIQLKAEKGTVANLTGGKLVARNGNVTLEAGAEAKSDIRVVDGIGNSKALAELVTDQEKLAAAGDHIVKTKQYFQASDGSWVEIVKTDKGEVVIPDGATKFKTEISYLDDSNQEISLATITGDRTSGLLEGYRIGDVVNRGDIIAQGKTEEGNGAITLHAKNGNVTNYDNFKLLDNKNAYDYLGETGKAHFNPGTPYFYDEKGILLSDSDLNIVADKGYLYNNMNIVSDRDVNLTSGKTLTIGTNVSSVVAKGNVVVRSNEGAVINDSHVESKEKNIILDGAKGVTSQVGSDHLKADNGSISAVSTKGDISIDQLVAGKIAVAGTKEGHVNVGTITGEDVLLYTEDENSKISVGEGGIHVKDHLFLQGNDFDISKIDRSENGGTLVVDVNGVGKDGTPSVVRGYLKLDIDGDVHFTTLQVSDADIQVGGKLAVDKLHVTGKGIFESQGYVTGVYGRAPYHDSSNALYFDLGQGKGNGSGLHLTADEFWALREGNPPTVRTLETLAGLRDRLEKAGNQKETFGTDNNGWMNLYVDGPYSQRSNGLLLHIDTHYRSQNQRWSVEDLSGKLLDYKPFKSFDSHYGDDTYLFSRYDLVERESQT